MQGDPSTPNEDLAWCFGRERRRMPSGDHVEVIRKEWRPGVRRRYSKCFLLTPAGDYRHWTGREAEVLAQLAALGVAHVAKPAGVSVATADRPARLHTFDAGVTVDQWATLVPARAEGPGVRHVFEDCIHWWALAHHSLIALDALHEHGFVHLDLKADNICIPPRGTGAPSVPTTLCFDALALIDFAFCVVSGEALPKALPLQVETGYEYQSSRLIGALAAGRRGDLEPMRALDWRCDVFSLAAMLWLYLPDPEEPGSLGWTAQRRAQATLLVRRLIDEHEAALPDRRPHGELLALTASVLEDGDLATGLLQGWTFTSPSPGAIVPWSSPLTRVATVDSVARAEAVAPAMRVTSPCLVQPGSGGELQPEETEEPSGIAPGHAAATPQAGRVREHLPRMEPVWSETPPLAPMAIGQEGDVAAVGSGGLSDVDPAGSGDAQFDTAAPRRLAEGPEEDTTHAMAEPSDLPVGGPAPDARPRPGAHARALRRWIYGAGMVGTLLVVGTWSLLQRSDSGRGVVTTPSASASTSASASASASAEAAAASGTTLVGATTGTPAVPSTASTHGDEQAAAATASAARVAAVLGLGDSLHPAPLRTDPRDASPGADGSLLREQIVQMARWAETRLAPVLQIAEAPDALPPPARVRAAMTTARLAPGRPSITITAHAAEARRLNAAARVAYWNRDNLQEALRLEVDAFAANPLDAEVAGNLAFYRMKQEPPEVETARQLALHSLALPDARYPAGRIEDWINLAITNALLGREPDARAAWAIALVLTTDVDRVRKAGIKAQAIYGDRLRPSVSAMLLRAEVAERTIPAIRRAATVVSRINDHTDPVEGPR